MGYREKCFSTHGDECVVCDDEADVAHHIDGNRENNDADNLAPLCYSCHQKVHSQKAVAEGWTHGKVPLAPDGEIGTGDDTTITVSEWTKEELSEHKAEGVTWEEFALWLLKMGVQNDITNEGYTSVSIERESKEELRDHRHPDHDNWDDTLTGMLGILPTIEDMQDGCANCGQEPFSNGPPEEQGGVIQWWSTEYEGSTILGSAYFCSPDCAAESEEERQNHIPEEPDEVIVGGKSEIRTTLEHASFYMDGETMEVGMPIPGAFDGSSSHGTEYNYVGEPVYVYHEGQYRQQGVIEEIIHEDHFTTLLLERGDYETVMLNHPDEERREQYKEQHAKWTGEDCAACGEEVRFMVEDPPETCPHCDAEEW